MNDQLPKEPAYFHGLAVELSHGDGDGERKKDSGPVQAVCRVCGGLAPYGLAAPGFASQRAATSRRYCRQHIGMVESTIQENIERVIEASDVF